MKDIAIWTLGIAAYTAAVYLVTKWLGKACDNTCPDCEGRGWMLGTVTCSTCNGERKI